MNVEELLNPAPERNDQDTRPKLFSTLTAPALNAAAPSQAPTSAVRTSLAPINTTIAHASSSKSKPKLPKDAPVYRKQPTRGDVVFPPHEAGDDQDLAQEYERFRIYPRGEIGAYCHRIPYSSDKKSFMNKTGRDAFEVFQYDFWLPDEPKLDKNGYHVMWDYNIGLVRITPFFKCCKYSKTTPAKVLNMNPGLRDISHSITGGALAAQGYWMPFECAKAVAATFAYNIRYALVPLFGKDFPASCIHPDNDLFANFKIDKAIVREATAETNRWLLRPDARLTPGSSSSREPSEVPGTPHSGVSLLPSVKRLMPKSKARAAAGAAIATSPESGYITDSDWTENTPTPNVSPKSSWATINRPQSSYSVKSSATALSADEAHAAESLMMLASPARVNPGARDIPRSVATPQKAPAEKKEDATPTPEKNANGKRLHDIDEEYDGSDSSSGSEDPIKCSPESATEPQSRSFTGTPGLQRAASALVQFGASKDVGSDDESVHREKRPRFDSIP